MSNTIWSTSGEPQHRLAKAQVEHVQVDHAQVKHAQIEHAQVEYAQVEHAQVEHVQVGHAQVEHVAPSDGRRRHMAYRSMYASTGIL